MVGCAGEHHAWQSTRWLRARDERVALRSAWQAHRPAATRELRDAKEPADLRISNLKSEIRKCAPRHRLRHRSRLPHSFLGAAARGSIRRTGMETPSPPSWRGPAPADDRTE